MGKLFKLALEEAVVEEPSIVENVPVEEAVQNAEELAKTDSEIQQDIAAVEELMEEKAKLEDQAVTNDELLSNPDAVVTATDVEVSEETRTEVQYSLGYTSSMGKIRLSQESVFNDVKSNPRKYLAISNEDIKDTIKKVWEKIKAFFKKIAGKLGIKTKAIKAKNVINEKRYKDIEPTIKDKNKVQESVKQKTESSSLGELVDKIFDISPMLGMLIFSEGVNLDLFNPKKYIDAINVLRMYNQNILDAKSIEDIRSSQVFIKPNDYNWVMSQTMVDRIFKDWPNLKDYIAKFARRYGFRGQLTGPIVFAFSGTKIYYYFICNDSENGNLIVSELYPIRDLESDKRIDTFKSLLTKTKNNDLFIKACVDTITDTARTYYTYLKADINKVPLAVEEFNKHLDTNKVWSDLSKEDTLINRQRRDMILVSNLGRVSNGLLDMYSHVSDSMIKIYELLCK